MRPLPPGERRVDAVYAALRSALLGGVLAPGQPLRVPDLARRLGVSRSPVREAVLRLAAEGLAQETARRGVSVARFGPAETLDLLAVRAALETAAVRRVGRADLGELERLTELQACALRRSDAGGYEAAALAFHRELSRCSGSLELERLVALYADRVALALGRLTSEQPLAECCLTDRRRLLEALARGDATGAVAALERHFARLRAALESTRSWPTLGVAQ